MRDYLPRYSTSIRSDTSSSSVRSADINRTPPLVPFLDELAPNEIGSTHVVHSGRLVSDDDLRPAVNSLATTLFVYFLPIAFTLLFEESTRISGFRSALFETGDLPRRLNAVSADGFLKYRSEITFSSTVDSGRPRTIDRKNRPFRSSGPSLDLICASLSR